MEKMHEILTLQQAADYLQLTPRTIQKYIQSGQIKAAKLGGRIRIRKSALDNLIDLQSEGGTPKIATATTEPQREKGRRKFFLMSHN